MTQMHEYGALEWKKSMSQCHLVHHKSHTELHMARPYNVQNQIQKYVTARAIYYYITSEHRPVSFQSELKNVSFPDNRAMQMHLAVALVIQDVDEPAKNVSGITEVFFSLSDLRRRAKCREDEKEVPRFKNYPSDETTFWQEQKYNWHGTSKRKHLQEKRYNVQAGIMRRNLPEITLGRCWTVKPQNITNPRRFSK